MSVTALLVLFNNLTVIEAVEALSVTLDAALDPVFVAGEKIQIVDLFNMSKDYKRLAKYFPLRFYGGPEGECRWWNGNLLNLVIDRLLSANIDGRQDAVDAVMKVGDSLAIK